MSDTISISRTELMQILDALVANRRKHYYCEDTWYSCPQHEEGCANDAEGDECTCGADEANIVIDRIIMNIHEYLEKGEVGKLPKRTPKAYHDPVLEPDLTASGEHYADVWHEGSQSYYHAKLLRKLTPEEVEFSCCPIGTLPRS